MPHGPVATTNKTSNRLPHIRNERSSSHQRHATYHNITSHHITYRHPPIAPSLLRHPRPSIACWLFPFRIAARMPGLLAPRPWRFSPAPENTACRSPDSKM
mmetsp:Transcript_7578/g.17081  ORF Transcript_7578/g.17081 Transcript_7578/m.17081 type:complete len:101 (-) Transcript_7578:1618-1920(-)